MIPVGPGSTEAAMFLLVGSGQIVTWILMWRTGRRNDNKRAADRAVEVASENAAIKELAAANTRIATALESLDRWAREHDMECAIWKTRMTEQHGQTVKDQERLAALISTTQRELHNWVNGLAPSVGSHVPASSRKARA